MDFTKKKRFETAAASSKIKSPFNIKSESSYYANLSDASTGGSRCLELFMKKTNCIAWLDIPEKEYHDHVIKAQIRLDSLGGYAAAGIMFRIRDEDSYYMALVSSKGYFRIDVVKDASVKALIAWTEVSDFDGININLKIITYGTYIIIVVNDKWAGEINDDSIMSGRVGFAAASYEETVLNSEETETTTSETDNIFTCKAMLDYFSVDPRTEIVEQNYGYWNDDTQQKVCVNINAEQRLRLAETFAVMGNSLKALEQINRAWKRRDEAISGVTAAGTEVRTNKELLLAARMSFSLAQYNEAEKFIDAILDQWAETIRFKQHPGVEDVPAVCNEAVRQALTEKVKILNELEKYSQLKEFALKHFDIINKDRDFYSLLARCYWELKEYNDSATAWDKAFKMDKGDGIENGIYIVNAANAYEYAGKKEEALSCYLEAGKIFLRQDNRDELAIMMPKLSGLGSNNMEARALAGKWAFSIEDYENCKIEFTAAEEIRRSLKPRPKEDPAVLYLWGLVSFIKGDNKDAIRKLEKAVKLAPDYELFQTKLAEIKGNE